MTDLTRDVTVILGIKPWKRWQIRPYFGGEPVRLAWKLDPDGALHAQRRLGGAIAVWAAREPDGFAARAAAQGAPLLRMEDGFLRSVGLGSNHVGAASLVVDREGIYFDPRTPSALERLIQAGDFDAPMLARAARLREELQRLNLTKYNVGGTQPVELGARPGQRRVLVVGQVENDASVRHGSPNVRSNRQLLEHVRRAEPGAFVAYKPHPDTEAGTRPGSLAEAEVRAFADQVVRDVSVTALFGSVDALHTMTSLAGFEALLRGVPVVTWGQPFYAGWGLTDDRTPLARRTRTVPLDALVAATLILYPQYRDPASGEPWEVERVVGHLAAQVPADARAQRSTWRRTSRLLAGLARARR